MLNADSITQAAKQDGVNWKTFRSGKPNVLGYTGNTGFEFTKSGSQATWTAQEICDTRSGKHFNYPPGNILLVVPQQLKDDDVPNITITAHGYQADADGNKTNGKEALESAIAEGQGAMDSNMLNIPELEAIIANLKQAIADFTEANYFIDFAAGEYYIIDA
jgi:hypothetical protein